MTYGGAARLLMGLVLGVFSLVAQQAQSREQNPPPAKAPEAAKADSGDVGGVGAPIDPKSYLIGAEDIIRITVWNEDKVSGQRLVRPDGKITIPLIGDLQAAGLTPERLGVQIAQALGEIYKDPQVTVEVSQVNSKKYYITGEVYRSGSFPLVVPTTVLDALGAAGGFRDFANKKNITILRQGKALKFNWNDVIKGKKLEQNILLQNGDHIIVP